jgi:hypothetical protein
MHGTKLSLCFPLVLPLALLTTIFYEAIAAATDADEITVSYLVPSTKITLHEPVVWRFQVHNSSSVAIQLDLGKNRNENFIVSYTGPQAGAPQTVRLRKGGFGAVGLVSVAPNETYEQDMLLNQWVSFAESGKYEIEIRLLQQESSRVEVHPFRTTIEILPLDPTRLRDVCSGLAQKVDDASSYQKASDAALALSFVRDPIAVPYLQRVLYAKQLVEPIAIGGLEQVGNEEAARVLVDALNGMSPDVALIARAALERMEKQTPNPQLKKLIQRSLGPTTTILNPGWRAVA